MAKRLRLVSNSGLQTRAYIQSTVCPAKKFLELCHADGKRILVRCSRERVIFMTKQTPKAGASAV